MSDTLDRVQKVVAQSDLTNRRKAEYLITKGRVQVNQKSSSDLSTKVSPKYEVAVDGILLYNEPFVYLLLYKPSGIISSVSDDKDRAVVTDLVQDVEERIF